jgi:murein DD-endopeptidase MepM/ murein hydrolase activator NlpD
MRITKVVFAFFSIGFLAGSFERAAGLGDIHRPRRVSEQQITLAVADSTKMVLASVGSLGSVLPRELLSPAFGSFADASERKSETFVLTTVTPLNPDLLLRRHAVVGKRMLSEPDVWAMSRLASIPPMSLPAWEWGARPDGDKLQRGNQDLAVQEFIMPFERGRLSSGYNQGRRHPAIDLAGAFGSPVHATTRRQRVIFAGWRGGYGNAVIARDDFGRQHLYGHLSAIVARVGTLLDQGQVLGRLGSTGHSTGPHVHYEVRARSGGHINPLTLLFPGRAVGRGFAWNGARSVTPRVAQANAVAQPRPR